MVGAALALIALRLACSINENGRVCVVECVYESHRLDQSLARLAPSTDAERAVGNKECASSRLARCRGNRLGLLCRQLTRWARMLSKRDGVRRLIAWSLVLFVAMRGGAEREEE